MLENNLIGKGIYTKNIVLRFLLQVVMPNRIRGWVFRAFAREKKSE